jgi:hypothetical protein
VYRLAVDGLGASEPFSIHDGAPAVLARSYALGLYHQRCGAANAAPYTRFIHDPCHTAPAQIPTNDHEKVNAFLQTMSEDDDPAMVPLSALGASYYPIRKQGELDVSGGHHDAGDYSKYTIHSAHFIHALMIGVDALDGVGDLDNLGLPESGDGVGDLMQMAMWEADFLSKMQDEDGGFFFLVYPRARRYESDVLPDKGDLQVVFPKNTAATGAAVAALAQIASSPRFKTAFPEKAARYLDQARKGWDFLIQAEARFGVGETYQRISHYGNLFGDADEYVWAAAELFLATGDAAYHRFLMSRFDPSDRRTRRWGWQRMVEGYGNAVRSYALAPETGRQRPSELDERYYRLCRDEAVAAAQEQVDYADGNAYGISFPFESKRFMNAGWFLAMDAGFDIVMGNALHPETPWMESLLTNVNYEAGANPNNMTYITGLGFRFPREIVHQYAQNDDRVLPPSGIPFGNIQAGFEAHKPYQKLLSALTFPPDDDRRAPYPLFDRWADAFNTRTEATMVKQARALTGYAWLMARTPLKNQPWRPAEARIVNMPEKPQAGKTYTLRLEADGLALDEAVIIWETSDREPVRGHAFALTAPRLGQGRIEAEAYLPDGRRVFARMDYQVGWW